MSHNTREVRLRLTGVLAIAVLVLAYTVGVVSGAIAGDEKIDSVHLALLGGAAVCVVFLLRPRALHRLRLFEFGGLKLEMLESVKAAQESQAKELEFIKLILPLLLPESERQHLFALADRSTNDFQGSGTARRELRRLRSVGLIKNRSGRRVHDISSGTLVDLADYVALTDLGYHWVERIRTLEQADDGAALTDD